MKRWSWSPMSDTLWLESGTEFSYSACALPCHALFSVASAPPFPPAICGLCGSKNRPSPFPGCTFTRHMILMLVLCYILQFIGMSSFVLLVCTTWHVCGVGYMFCFCFFYIWLVGFHDWGVSSAKSAAVIPIILLTLPTACHNYGRDGQLNRNWTHQ